MLPVANVLLVDDHPENLLALTAMLETLGQNLVTANSGAEALKKLLEQDFAVILLDIKMADMDGFETATLIKEREKTRQIPIIFITAYGQTDAQVFKGYALGAVDYLFKPVTPEILRAKVSSFIDLFQKTEQVKQQAGYIEAVNKELETRMQEVNHLNQELGNINRELETFSYSVSHDLRAPLRSISGFSQALIADYYDKLDEQGREYLHWIETSCQQMGNLIDDLLELARLTNAKMETQPVNLSALAAEVIENLTKSAPQRHVQWAITPDMMAQGDKQLLRIVLENLLGNAWKFTSKREDATIEFNHQKGVFFIRDNGAGFNIEYVEQLFQPFHRLHEDEFEGHGIGLSTVQRIIHRHGGRIWAEGIENEGATFYFTLA